MLAEFYIVAESFANNSHFTTPEIESKIKSLAEDFNYIRKYRETNKLFVHPDIYNIYFLNGILLSDLLFNPLNAKKYLDRDVYNALQKIIIESEQTTHSSEEVIEVLLPEYNHQLCHGLIAFNAVDAIQPEFQIVYNLQGWFDFRRYFLGQYPKDANFFISECRKYFPNLIFHNNTITTIQDIIDDFRKKVIYHLSALNDKFRESQDGLRNRQQVLEHFSGNCSLDETASLEGHANRKPYFTYNFINNKGNPQSVCCEPHLKLCKSDAPGDNTYYQHRIYFHEGFQNISDNKILVGHIGEHINFN
jgi:hypothetical protein